MAAFSTVFRKDLPLLIVLTGVIVSLWLFEHRAEPGASYGFLPEPLSLVCERIPSSDMRYGDAGDDVANLQRILNQSSDTRLAEGGPGAPGLESGYFGPLTYFAVVRFQEKYASEILYPFALFSGTGIVGPNTREKIKSLCTEPASLSVPAPEEEGDDGGWGILSVLAAIIFILGISFSIWIPIGILRVLHEWLLHIFNGSNGIAVENSVKPEEVAVIVPAHNEELVIKDTLDALKSISEPKNIFVISDGSNDKTGEIARAHGANVLELNPSKGKAGALEYGIQHFNISSLYKAVLLVDADTRLKTNYLKMALPFFNDREVVAVAGYASTLWNKDKLSLRQKFFVLHRERIYFLFQMFVKFGQTWKYTNVSHIIPGFASIYRTSILDKINMNPKGLVIEDFNMTFEVHHKKLGIIAHHPSIVAYTQDPDNLQDYYRQIRRWHLGFWQTVRMHGFWPSKFWASMAVTLTEVILGSLAFLLMPVLIILYLLFLGDWLAVPFGIDKEYILAGLVVTWLLDFMLTIIVAAFQGRKDYLLVGLLFPLLRLVDGFAFLIAIPKAFLVNSDGRWVSPSRRSN